MNIIILTVVSVLAVLGLKKYGLKRTAAALFASALVFAPLSALAAPANADNNLIATYAGDEDTVDNDLLAEEPEAITTGETAAESSGAGLGLIAAAVAVGLSCVGAGIAIAATAPAAIGAFSENPKAFGKALIFVVLGEGVALYGLLISILIINKI